MRKKAEYRHTGWREPRPQRPRPVPLRPRPRGGPPLGLCGQDGASARAPGEVGVPGQASLLPSRFSRMRAGHRLWAPRPLPTVGTDECSNTHA